MKFRVNNKYFQQAVQNIVGVVPLKTTVPILADILLELEGNQLKLTGTDLEVSISTTIEVQGESDGSVAVPARMLFEVVKELPDIPLEFECASEDGGPVTLSTEQGFYRLAGESKEEFPRISVLPESMNGSQTPLTVDAQHFDRMANKALFAVSTDELRTTLMGVFLQVLGDEMRIVATDGHRLVKVEDKTFRSPGFQGETIVPTKALNLLSKNIRGVEKLNLSLSEDHILFDLGPTTIFSKSIEGQFPSYERVIPIDNDKELIVNRELLSAAVRRVAIFSNSITHQIRLSVAPGTLGVQSEDIEFGGEAKETLESQYSGEPFEVGYNANYLLDVLRHLDTEEVIFKLKDSLSAGLIYPGVQSENEETLMVLMPIRLNDD